MIDISKYCHNPRKYSKLGKNNSFKRLYHCECCGYRGSLHRHGFYYRNIILFNFYSRIPILRYKCPNKNCNKTYSLLPDFVIPYHQYSFGAILFCLYLSYVKKKSSSSIQKFLKDVVSRQLIHQYKIRFQSQLGKLRMFFSSLDGSSFNISENPNTEVLVSLIMHYTFYPKHFNSDFLDKIRIYFMKRPPV